MTGLTVHWEQIGEVLALLFVISLVFETALTPIFNWRFFAKHFEGKGVKTPHHRRGRGPAVELRYRHLQAHHRRLCRRRRQDLEQFRRAGDDRASGRRRQRSDLQHLHENEASRP